MGYQTLSRDNIAAITTLHKAGHTTWAICNQTGVKCPPFKREVKRVTELGDSKITTEKKMPGNTRKTFLRTLRVVHRVAESNPRVLARKIRQVNLGLLGNVFVKTISCRLHDDLHTRATQRGPSLCYTVAQKRKRHSFCEWIKAWTTKQWRGVLI